ncbi:MAG: CDP-alcohol phosphatidyltransferase family protein [Brevefilum sp.]|nr:CDP-alcohol phosphatidyltransferase family protein [Brevefilum sp.]
MFDNYLRGIKDRLAEPLARKMWKVDPNSLTLMGLLIGIGSAVLAYFGFYIWAFAFWLFNRSLDGLDGVIARMYQKQDDFGGYLDILSDFVVYAALPIGVVLGAPSQVRYVILIIMLGIFYINTASWMYLAAILEKRAKHDPETTTTIVMPTGLVGGFETIVFFSLFILFPAHVTVFFLVYTVLVIFSIFQRLVWAKRQFRPITLKDNQHENQYISTGIYTKE